MIKYDYNPNNDAIVRMEQLKVSGMYLINFSNGSGTHMQMMCDTWDDAESCYSNYLQEVNHD
jgi:hypothetical protein